VPSYGVQNFQLTKTNGPLQGRHSAAEFNKVIRYPHRLELVDFSGTAAIGCAVAKLKYSRRQNAARDGTLVLACE
jgi:hypothetical protein